MNRILYCLIICSAYVLTCVRPKLLTDVDTIDRIDELMEFAIDKLRIPGIALGIFVDGSVFHAKGFGYASLEHKVPVKIETIFQSGSVGKQFTAMAVMILVEQRKLSLDDKINKYFTDAPIKWNNITIRHLLTHTSGMTDYPKNFNFRNDYTENAIYELIKSVQPAFQAGEQWYYSNIGYVLLGILIRRVTNQFYGDFIKQNIFYPLGMTTAQVINEADIIPNRASGYIMINEQLKNQPWVSPTLNTFADGSLYLSLLDMMKWDNGLYGNQVLKNQSSFDAMWSPVTLNNGTTVPYGFGWHLSQAKSGTKIVEHGGIWQGFQSMIIRVLAEKVTIAFFSNLNHENIFELAHIVLGIYNPQLSTIPDDLFQQFKVNRNK